MIQEHKVTMFYTAPTAIRSLIKAAEADAEGASEAVRPVERCACSARVGEPINPEAWMWYYHNVGNERCPIVDTFWQTETGGHMITPLPGVTPLVPGSCTLPLPGIMAAIVDETGHDVPNGQGGILVIKRPWPSMIRTHLGRSRALPEELLPRRARRHVLISPATARCAIKRHRLLHDHGPHRRRAQRVGPSPRHDGDRVRARRQSASSPKRRWSGVPTT